MMTLLKMMGEKLFLLRILLSRLFICYTIETTNGDPWATAGLFKEDVPEECNVLEFEYQTEMGMSNLELFFADAKNGIDATHSMSAGTVPASTEWASFSVRLKKYRQEFDWGKVKDFLRLDFGDQPNNIIQMRNIRLRMMNDEEKQAEEDENNEALNKEKYEQGIKDYLNKEYDCHVTDVVVGESTISIQGNYTGEGTFFLGICSKWKRWKIKHLYQTALLTFSWIDMLL